MKSSCFRSLLLGGLFLLCDSGTFEAFAEEKVIRLRNESIVTRPAAPGEIHLQIAEPPASGLYIIQFRDRVDPGWRQQLRARRVELLRYVPDDAFVARLDEVHLQEIRSQPFVQWVGPYRPEHKLHEGLRPAAVGEPLAVRFLVAPDAAPRDLAVIRRFLHGIDHESASRFGRILQGSIPPGQLRALAESPSVLWVEPAPRVKLLDEIAAKIVAGDDGLTGTHALVHQLGFDGTGVTVAVPDSGLYFGDAETMHPDLFGRVTAFFHYGNLTSAADEHSHGTHVAGIVAGNASIGETDQFGYRYGLGIAPGANIVAQRIFDGLGRYTLLDNDFRRLARDAVESGAEIGSNSWGADSQGRYDLMAAEYDALVRDADVLTPGDQPFILQFSAGNAGPGSQTIGTPAVAKNVIATGAAQNDRFDLFIYDTGRDAMADFSSRGPAEDGRIKPDVVAPGTWIASLKSALAPDYNAWLPISANYLYQGGTSQSGPQVSGAAAVFVQYYRETITNATPSPALVKAALINSAVDMDDSFGTRPIPNMDEGWGRVDLTQVIGSPRHYEFIDQTVTLSTGQTYEHRVLVAASDEPLKVTLAYTDVPGLPAAIPALVNDLDLEVIAPGGVVYRGNQFDLGESVPNVGAFDTINNVEAVHLWEPLPGEYIVRIHARNVAEDARQDTAQIEQDFALVVSGNIPLPGVGILFFDRRAYRAPDSIDVRLIDFDLAGQSSVPVLLSSSTESAKTILLEASGPPGFFAGTVATTTGAPADEWELQVSHGDFIEARYEDASPPGTRIATARVDLVPPVITNVASTNRFGRTLISWQTDEPATGIVPYGTDSQQLDSAATNPVLRQRHEVALENLVADTTYYFLIISTDEAGNVATNDNNGALFSFIAQPAATVLLVDAYEPDEFGESPFIPRSAYTGPLDQTGIDYEIWDVSLNGSPTVDDLRPFQVVIWRINDSFWMETSLNGGERTAITSYLEEGGGFFMASMEILSRLGDVPFRRDVLQVGEFITRPDPFAHCAGCDEDVGVPEVEGVPYEAMTSGIWMPLNYSAYPDLQWIGLDLGPDLSDTFTPTTNATSVLRDPWTGRNAGIRFPPTGVDSPSRVVFFSFPFDAMPEGGSPPNTRANLLRNVISFLAPGVGGLGTVAMNNTSYTIPALVTVEVADSDLIGQGQLTIQVGSNTDPGPHSVTLFETVRPGLFRGNFTLVDEAAPPGTGELRVRNFDEVWAEYFDESNSSLARVAARVDTDPPEIFHIELDMDYGEAHVSWTSSEPADALVQFGESQLLSRTAYRADHRYLHDLLLTGLQHDQQYFFRVVSRDAAGNPGIDDNQGNLYTFRTPRPKFTPWSDDMSTDADWRVIDGEFAGSRWQLGVPNNGQETAAVSPPNAWGSNLNGWATDYADSLLLSPAILLEGGSRATLGFWHSYDFLERSVFDIYEAGWVLITTNNGRDWIELKEYWDDASAGWEEAELDLSRYIGQTVRIGFYYGLFSLEYEARPGWLIDDVSVIVDGAAIGTIEITSNLAQAGFQLSGPVSFSGSGWTTTIPNAPAGDYTLEFDPAPFHQTPEPQTKTLAAGTTLVFEGNYTFVDTYDNGISDQWEEHFFGEVSSERTRWTDSDGNGMSDYEEFIAGTDPNNPESLLALGLPEVLENGGIRFEWSSVPGRAYRLRGSADVETWEPVSDWAIATEPVMVLTVPPLEPEGPYLFRLEVRP